MDSQDYINKAMKTESQDFEAVASRVGTRSMLRILHATMGVSTEAGELLDAVKKTLFYGKPLDTVNLKEEVGDLFWYMAILCDELGLSFEEAMERNIAKLKARYGDKFSEEMAQNRNLELERATLELSN